MEDIFNFGGFDYGPAPRARRRTTRKKKKTKKKRSRATTHRRASTRVTKAEVKRARENLSDLGAALGNAASGAGSIVKRARERFKKKPRVVGVKSKGSYTVEEWKKKKAFEKKYGR